MSSLIRKAKRSEAYLKIGVTGPSGSGKTYSALLLAKGLNNGDLSKVVVIDTENKSADLYSNLGDYSVFPFSAPYGPERYCNAIRMAEAEGFNTIIIDSVSHEWDGAGGCLEIQTNLGGRYQDWAKVTPMHKRFIDAILQSKCHIITTARKKTDYALDSVNGKTKVTKMGTKEIQREGFEYELTLNLDINQEHHALASKDRTSLFASNVPFIITEETGQLLRRWNQGE